ncbi:MAG: PadR family transcriptional regulator [Salinibacter sp.]
MRRDVSLAFMRVHVLHHAAREPFYGAAMMEELRRHGYDISPGTFYPMLHRLDEKGLLDREERVVDGKVRKYYAATADGEAVLDEIRPRLQELVDEVLAGEGPDALPDPPDTDG